MNCMKTNLASLEDLNGSLHNGHSKHEHCQEASWPSRQNFPFTKSQKLHSASTLSNKVGDKQYICMNKSDIFRISLSGSWHKGHSQHLQHQDAAKSSLQDFPDAYSERNSTPNPSAGLRRCLTSDEPVTTVPDFTRK